MSDKLLSETVQQLSLEYFADEDRLFLKTGFSDETEYSIWLTRRTVKSIWFQLKELDELDQSLNHVPDEVTIKREVSPIETLNQAAIKRPELEAYKNRVSRLLHPVLASSCEVKEVDLKFTSLEFVAKDDHVLRIVLNDELKKMILKLLDQGLKEASWNIGAHHAHIMVSNQNIRPLLH